MAKSKKKIVTVEVETTLNNAALKKAVRFGDGSDNSVRVKQVQVNAIIFNKEVEHPLQEDADTLMLHKCGLKNG